MRGRLLAVAVCALSAAAGTAEDKPTGDGRLLQGSWDWDPAAKQSDAQPQILLERVVVKGNTLTFHYRFGGTVDVSPTTFTLDPAATPKAIDFVPTEGANKGQTYVGLYEVGDGRLRICYRGPGDTRPRNFDDKADKTGSTVFIVLKKSPSF